jgi:hypothetical protein
MARAEARAMLSAWLGHLRHCSQCSTSQRRRAWEHLCDEGFSIWDDKRCADFALERERQLDAEPIPGQEGLF